MEEIKLHFGGQTHLINANTYINTLLHFTNVVERINEELSPETKVEVKVRANEPGSFVSDIAVVAQTVIDPLVNNPISQTVGYVSTLVEMVGGVYKLAKFLSGKPPKSVETIDGSVRIEKNDGNVTYIDNRTFNIYQNNKTVRNSIAQGFETLSEDPSVTSFDLWDRDDNPITEVPRDQFSDIANDDSIGLQKNERVIRAEFILNVIALDLELKKKWDFYNKGVKISAKIKDDQFLKRINKGEKFGKGDSLKVVMEIRQELDESVATYVNKSYTIVEILEHYSKPEEGKFTFE